MNLTGLLCFYDERVEDLMSCMLAFRQIGASHVVAVDGAYALYPDGAAASDSKQQAAITLACRDLGMGLTLHVPSEVWEGNEVAKRTFLFGLGLMNCADEDWMVVMDADQVFTKIPDDLYDRLEATEHEVAEVTFTEKDVTYTRRILFRAQPILLRDNHWTHVTAAGRVLWASIGLPQEPATDLLDLVVEHRPDRREPKRLERKLLYYASRDADGVELVNCERCRGQAVKRVLADPVRKGDKVIAKWAEVCEPCSQKIYRESREQLIRMGADPDKTVFG